VDDLLVLLKVRGNCEDRFIVLETQVPLLRRREENIRWSQTEDGARSSLKAMGFTDDEIAARIAEAVNGPYVDEPFDVGQHLARLRR